LWYNAADALTTLEIYDILRAQLAPTNVTQVYECDKEMVDIAIDWYKRGILIDMEAVDAMKLEYTNDACTGLLDELDIKIKEMAGIDFNPQFSCAARQVSISRFGAASHVRYSKGPT